MGSHYQSYQEKNNEARKQQEAQEQCFLLSQNGGTVLHTRRRGNPWAASIAK